MLVFFYFEIHAAIIKFNFLQAVHRGHGGRRPVDARGRAGNCFCRRQPSFQVPAPLRIAHQDQARLAKRHRAKFKVPAQKSPPAQTGAQAFGAQKIFVAKTGIFADRHVVGIEPRAGQDLCIEISHLHGTAKRTLQLRYEISVHSMRANEQRNAGLQSDHRHYDRQRRFPPLSQRFHFARKFRRLMRKRVGASLG